jgi:hypothetical protein
MRRNKGWMIAGLVIAGFLILGLSNVLAQRFAFQPGMREGDVGRFVVVRSSADLIVIMDTTNGNLYSAGPSDIKPYAARTRFIEPRRAEKDGIPLPKGRIPDFKDKGDFDRGGDKDKIEFRKGVDKDLPAFKDKAEFKAPQFEKAK